MRKIIIQVAGLLLVVIGVRAQSVFPPASGGTCVVTGSQTSGYVLTATDNGTACAWQTVGGASVDQTTIKNAWYIADGGSANAITGTTTTTYPGSYAAGQAVIVKMNATNTGATTININSLGTKAVTKSGTTALAAGNLVSGRDYLLVYDGTEFQVIGFTVLAADVPTLNQNTTGNAATATALAANPVNCSAGNLPRGVDAFGVAEGCNPVDLTADVGATVLPNANTTAASANTASAIVARDGTGNFTAGTVTAALTGTASGNPPNARAINTTSPITGGGNLAADRTFACATCVTSGSSLTSTAIMTGAGSQASQTPCATCTLDSSGNVVFTSVSTGGASDTSCDGTSGCVILHQGTAPFGQSASNGIQIIAPTSLTSYRDVRPGTVGATGADLVSVSGTVATHTYGKVTSTQVDNSVALTGTDINTSNQVTATHLATALPVTQGGWGLATLTAHLLYVGNGTTAPSSVAIGTSGQCLTSNGAGSDPTFQTCGTGSGVSSFTGDGTLINNSSSTGAVTATLATAAAHKAWMNNTGSTAAPGYQSIGTADLPAALANQTSINGLAITASTGTLSITNGKTLAVSNTITLAGTDSTTQTLPGTSQTIPGMNQVNTAGTAFTLDASGSTASNAVKVPVGAGLTAGADGVIAYDSTGKLTHVRTNGADSSVMAATSTSTTTTQVPHATAVAGVYAPSAIVTGDLPTALANQTSINGLGITASTGTLTITNGKTLAASNTITLAGTDGVTYTGPSTSQTIPGMNQANTAGSSYTLNLTTNQGAQFLYGPQGPSVSDTDGICAAAAGSPACPASSILVSGTNEASFATNIALPANGLGTANRALHVYYGFDQGAANTQPNITFRLRACPTANLTTGNATACSSGGALLWASNAGTWGSPGVAGVASYEFLVQGGGSNQLYTTLVTNSNLRPATNVAQTTKVAFTTTSAWTLYLTVTFSTATAGNYVLQSQIVPQYVN